MIHGLPITIWIFPFSKSLADIVEGAAELAAFHGWGGRAVVTYRRPVGQAKRCCPTAHHWTTTQVDGLHSLLTLLSGFVTHTLLKLEASRQTVTHASVAFLKNIKCFQVWWMLCNLKSLTISSSPKVFLFIHYSLWVWGRNNRKHFYSSPVVK